MLLRKLTTQAQKHNIMAPISNKLALGAGCYWGKYEYRIEHRVASSVVSVSAYRAERVVVAHDSSTATLWCVVDVIFN
jgi:hypothetical protein